jgi:hypothetical protein
MCIELRILYHDSEYNCAGLTQNQGKLLLMEMSTLQHDILLLLQ